MHHIPQDSWARLTVRLVSPTCPEFVGPHWLALLYHCTIFIVICKGVSLVFFESFFGMVFAVVNRRKLFAGKDLRLAGPAPPTLSRWYIRTYVVKRKKENFVIIE